MPERRPYLQILTKPEASDTFTDLGGAWKTSGADVFSVSLDLERTFRLFRFLIFADWGFPLGSFPSVLLLSNTTSLGSFPSVLD